MGISAGIGIGDLLGSLFFPAAAEGAVDLGAAAAADVGLGAAAGGAADLGLGVALPAATDIAAGGTAADLLGAAGTGAVTGAGEDLSAFLPAAIESGALGGLGTDVVGAQNALEFAPTAADTAGVSAGEGAIGAAPGTTSGVSGGAGALSSVPVSSPTQAIAAGDANIAAQLGDLTGTGAGGEATAPFDTGSTAALASGNSAAANVANTAAGVSPNVASTLANGASPASSGVLGNITSTLSNPLVQLGVPAAFLGYNLLKGPAPIPPQAQQAVTNAQNQLGPLQGLASQNVPLFNQTAANDLNLANNFQISPQQAAALQTWKQDQYNQLIQQIANQQPGVDYRQTSEWVQGKNQIDQQALGQQVQMINQLISTAFQSASAANAGVSTSANVTAQFDATLMQAAQLQVQQDQNFQNAVGSALQAFGLIAGLNAGKFAKTPATATVTT